MATARAVKDWDRVAFAWVEIEDEDGVTHRYGKKRAAAGGSTVHVSYGLNTQGTVQSLGLVRDDGTPVLKQDDQGLPGTVVVQYLDAAPQPQGAPLSVDWEAMYEYERE